MNQLISVGWLYRKGNKLLCVKSKGKDKFFIPGGKLEVGETYEEGLQREIREELNIELIPNSIQYLFSVTDIAYGLENTQLTMFCYIADFNGDIAPSSEIETAKWFELSQIHNCAPAAQKAMSYALELQV